MSNILERINPTDGNPAALLRAWADVIELPSGSFVNDDLRFGADTITRLTAEVEQNAIDLEEYRRDVADRDLDVARLTARVEELEGALKLHVCDCKSNCEWESDTICPSWEARAAITKGERNG
jgi:hypothetical protein